jgi:hypothetical protein
MAITNGYTTGSAVKQALGIIDATSDNELELVIESVSRMIDDYTGRFFYQSAASTAFYTAQDYLVQPIDDFASVSSITTDGDADGTYTTNWIINTDCSLAPFNAATTGRPFTEIIALTEGANTFPVQIVRAVRVVGTRGWPSIPKPVEMATVIQCGRIFNRRNTPFGIASAPEVGQMRLLARLDPDVEQMLRAYRVAAQAV